MAKKKSEIPPTTELEISKIGKIEELTFVAMEGRSSAYDAIYATMAKLKAGNQFTVPSPKGIPIATFKNRINAALRRGPAKPPEGCMFRKRMTVGGEIAICCIKEGTVLSAKSIAAKSIAAKSIKSNAKKAGVTEPAPHPDAE